MRRQGFDPQIRRVYHPTELKEALQEDWDVVISDYVLPGFSGIEALKIVKEADPYLPFIMVSGRVDEDTAVSSIKAGAQDCIMKDNLRRLAPAIDRELREVVEHKERDYAKQAAEARSKRQTEVLGSLYEGAERLTYSTGQLSLADIVCKTCHELFGLDFCWFGRVDMDGKITGLAVTDMEGVQAADLTPRWDIGELGQGPTGKSIRSAAPVVHDTLQEEPGFALILGNDLVSNMQSASVFPLVSRERVVGVLNLASHDPNFFTMERMEQLRSYCHQVAFALENSLLFSDATSRLERLAALHTIEMAISSRMDLQVTFRVVMETAINRLHVDAVRMFNVDESGENLSVATSRGWSREAVSSGYHFAQRATDDRSIVMLSDLENEADADVSAFSKEGFRSCFAFPLISNDRVLGVMELCSYSTLVPESEWLDFASAVATQVGIALDNFRLVNDLQKSNEELTDAYEATIEGWAHALELRDRETEGHARRVTEMTLKLAERLGMPEDELVHIRRGALLHDIGKLGVPDSILHKAGPLDSDERHQIEMHPVYAYSLLSQIPFLRRSISIPYAHHEKWDGSGYPLGKKGEDIPLSARVFAVIDVWDALSSDRPYRPAWPQEKVLNYIKEQRGSHFDPSVVDQFVGMMEEASSMSPWGRAVQGDINSVNSLS